MSKRVTGLDVLRGTGIMLVVFMHSALFQFGNLGQIDFANPPLVVTLMGFLLMWAGLFAMISMMANTAVSLVRTAEDKNYNTRRALMISGLYLLVAGFIYFMFLGPPLLDLEGGRHQYSLVQGLLRGVSPVLHADRFFYVNALIMLGLNQLLLAPVLCWLLRVRRRAAHYYWLLGGTIFVMLLSLLRLPLYPLYQEIYGRGSYLVAFFFGLLVNKNNPILPFLAFGLLGMLIALLLFESPVARKNMRRLVLLGVAIIVISIAGLTMLPDSMLERDIDMFWYLLMCLQLGLFTLLLLAVVRVFDFSAPPRIEKFARASRVFSRFGVATLTVFMLETPVGELTAKAWSLFWPGWDQTINVTLLYAGFNVLLWAVFLAIWQRYGFKFSLEWWGARIYGLLGRPSVKDKGGQLLK